MYRLGRQTPYRHHWVRSLYYFWSIFLLLPLSCLQPNIIDCVGCRRCSPHNFHIWRRNGWPFRFVMNTIVFEVLPPLKCAQCKENKLGSAWIFCKLQRVTTSPGTGRERGFECGIKMNYHLMFSINVESITCQFLLLHLFCSKWHHFLAVTRNVSICKHLLPPKENDGGRKHLIYLNAIKFIECNVNALCALTVGAGFARKRC